jgi:hypothetical protein
MPATRSVARHNDHLEILIELDVVLPISALRVIDLEVTATLGLFFHLAACAAQNFYSRFDLRRFLRLHGNIGECQGAAADEPSGNECHQDELHFQFLQLACRKHSGTQQYANGL